MGMYDFHITIVFAGASILCENSLWRIVGNTEIPKEDIYEILNGSRGIKRVKDNFYKSKYGAEIYLHNNDLSEAVGIEIKGMLGNIEKNSEEIFKLFSRFEKIFTFEIFLSNEKINPKSKDDLSDKIKTAYKENYLLYKKVKNRT